MGVERLACLDLTYIQWEETTSQCSYKMVPVGNWGFFFHRYTTVDLKTKTTLINDLIPFVQIQIQKYNHKNLRQDDVSKND